MKKFCYFDPFPEIMFSVFNMKLLLTLFIMKLTAQINIFKYLDYFETAELEGDVHFLNLD